MVFSKTEESVAIKVDLLSSDEKIVFREFSFLNTFWLACRKLLASSAYAMTANKIKGLLASWSCWLSMKAITVKVGNIKPCSCGDIKITADAIIKLDSDLKVKR